jgi:hypothetical protein
VNDDPPDLARLGQVDPPAPGVLDAAREVLWSAVAAEMLATAPPGATPVNTAHAGTAHGDATRAGGEPAAAPNAGEPPGQPRRADLGGPHRADPGESRRADPGAP